MNRPDEKPRGRLTEGTPVSAKELEALKEQIQEMQLEIDILKETVNVLKKDPGANKVPLNNREKAVIVDALKEKYPLPLLLSGLRFAKSSYYYQRKRKTFSEKHADDRKAVAEVFNHNHQRYGYRRIKIELDKTGRLLSEKVIRRIMGENGMTAKLSAPPSLRKSMGVVI